MLHARVMEPTTACPTAQRTAATGVQRAATTSRVGNQAMLGAKVASQSRPSRAPLLQRECAACKDEREKLEMGLQTKLAVNTPGDVYEQEADRVADQVMRMPQPAVQAQSAPSRLQRQSSAAPAPATAPPIVHEVLRQPGAPLDADTRAFMEPRFGADFGAVRIHADGKAAASARAVNARAYTAGRNIVFAEREYAPGAASGRQLLAHELTHVLQQNPAEPGGEAVQRLAVATANTMPEVQRQADGEEPPQTQPDMSDAAGGSSGEAAPGVEVQQLSDSSSGGGGGAPGAGIPDCTAVMGGRLVDHWLAGGVLGMNHTYVNFKENAANYWLVEAGPLPADPHHVGAWSKPGQWESRGNRIMSTYTTPEACATAKTQLFATQTKYHSMTLPYDPTNGPNSNSFTEHASMKTPFFGIFTPFDWKWAYWRSHTRPF
jgi:hypothetical protein